MSIPIPLKMCDGPVMNAMGHGVRPGGTHKGSRFFPFAGMLKRGLQVFTVVATALSGFAETTNTPVSTNTSAPAATPATATNSVPQVADVAPASTSSARGFDESAFRIVAERNIFNANRSGGQVRVSSSRRPTRVDSFALVGTMAYQKGVFAFFQGSSSEFTKVIKTNDVIAGYTLVNIQPNGVKLEAEGKDIELPVGSQMRREDQGTWQVAEGGPGQGGDASSLSGTVTETSGSNGQSIASASSSNSQSDILKRLMERRAKESQ
jgi:hypothetical protein